MKKIRNQKIIMKNWFVIKTFNFLDLNFDITIAIINVEIHKNIKFFSLNDFIERLKRCRRMNRTFT